MGSGGDKPTFQFPAMVMGHTPSGPVAVCEMHAQKLNALAKFMGFHVVFNPLEAFAECSNCVNEAKSAGRVRGMTHPEEFKNFPSGNTEEKQ